MSWYPDGGLATLIGQWRERHPRAVVGTIADKNHEPPSDHLPEEDGSVDAGDFMPGNGVSDTDLDDLAETLRRNRDRRIAYVIRRDKIFSSTVRPWEWRDYNGPYHHHTHVSVNDRHENDRTRWVLGGAMADETTLDQILTVVKRIDSRGPKWHQQDEGAQPRADGRVYGWVQIQKDVQALRDELIEIRTRLDLVTGPLDYDQLARAILREAGRPD